MEEKKSKYSPLSSLQDIAIKKPKIEWEEAKQNINERYQILSVLGQGGQGIVWEVYDSITQREVALKQSNLTQKKHIFLQEVTLQTSFHHSSIPPIFEIHDGEIPYFTMHKIDGVKLSDFLYMLHELPNKNLRLRMMVKDLTLRDLMHIFRGICDVVRYLHERNYVHRDLKPQNILIDSDYKVYLIDFGLTTITEEAKDLCGTKNYVDPRYLFESQKSKRVDIYALGMILLSMTTATSYQFINNSWQFFPYNKNVDLDLSLREYLKAIETLQIMLPKCSKPLSKNISIHGISRIYQHAVGVNKNGVLEKSTAVYSSIENLQKDIDSLLNFEDGVAFRQTMSVKIDKVLRRYPKSVTTIFLLLSFSIFTFISFSNNYLQNQKKFRTTLKANNIETTISHYQKYSFLYKKELQWLSDYLKFKNAMKDIRFAFYSSYMIKPFYDRMPLYSDQPMMQASRILKLAQEIFQLAEIVETQAIQCDENINYFFYRQNFPAQKAEIHFIKKMTMFLGKYVSQAKIKIIMEDLGQEISYLTNPNLQLSIYFVTRNVQAVKKFTEKFPSFAWGHMVRAVQLFCEKKYDQSRLASVSCIALNPQQYFPYLLMSLSCFEDKEKANQYLLRIQQKNNDHLYLLKGDIYFYHRMYSKAFNNYNSAIKINPNAKGYFRRGNTHLFLNNINLAIKDFSWALRISDQPSFYLQRGLAHFYQKNYSAAISDFNTVILLEPNNSEGYIRRSDIHLAQNLYSKAIKDLNLAIEKNPLNEQSYLKRSEIYAAKKKYDLAITDISSAIKLQPQQSNFYQKRAHLYLQSQNFEQVIVNLNVVLQKNRNDWESIYLRAICYLKQQNIEHAFSDFSNIINNGPSHALAHYQRGTIYAQKNKYALALLDFKIALKISPNYAPVYIEQAKIYALRNDFVRAIESLDQLLILNPNHDLALYTRGVTYIKYKQFVKAIRDFDVLIQNDKTNTKAYYQKAIVLWKQTDLEKALENFRQVVQLDPQYKEAYYFQGLVYIQMNKWQDAVKQLDKALKIDKSYRDAIFQRGIAYLNLPNIAKAHRDFSSIFYLPEYRKLSYFYLACIYALQGKKIEALSLLEESINLGMKDLDLIKKQQELKNISKTPEYIKLLKKLAK
ncbi:tetratricopeptide repeat protein [Candidatus Uabimicrobium sp. HlEnr_7]|uniref:tetratricopeptide repeat protein n=1 Tax=Candidatus Uabimicrobium helgolandensis TaxID=3095367 RepID=UPI0035580860